MISFLSLLALLVLVAGFVGIPTVLVLSAMDTRKWLRIVNRNLKTLDSNHSHDKAAILFAIKGLSDKVEGLMKIADMHYAHDIKAVSDLKRIDTLLERTEPKAKPEAKPSAKSKKA